MKVYLSLIAALLICAVSPLRAQQNDAQPDEVGVNRFDEKVWKDVVGSKDYTEQQPQKKPKPADAEGLAKSSGKRVKPRDQNAADTAEDDSSSGFSFESGIPFDIIMYVLVGGIIVYILFLIVRNISLKADRKVVVHKSSPTAAGAIEDIHELETDRLLREAIAAGNYRLAVRMCFLGMLKTLDEKEIIKWKRDKTNRDYLSELRARQHFYDEIRHLTINYERVWYGDHDLNQGAYEELISAFQVIGGKLNASARV